MTVLMFHTELLREWFFALLPWAGFFGLAVVLDLFGGVALALYKREFEWSKFPETLRIAPLYFWAWMTIEIFAFAPEFFGVSPDGWVALLADFGPKVVFALIVVGKYGASIIEKVKEVLAIVRFNPKEF